MNQLMMNVVKAASAAVGPLLCTAMVAAKSVVSLGWPLLRPSLALCHWVWRPQCWGLVWQATLALIPNDRRESAAEGSLLQEFP